MIKNAKKICIIGGPGTGKSTLANNLEKEQNIHYDTKFRTILDSVIYSINKLNTTKNNVNT